MFQKHHFLVHFINLLLLLFILVGIGLERVDVGFFSWESRGDSHFYAKCAEYFLESGIFRWFELYPIALKEGLGIQMAWTAIVHPLSISALSYVTSLSPQKASIVVSSLTYVSMLFMMFYFAFNLSKNYLCAWIFLISCFFMKSSYGFSASGGTESLSQFFLVMSFWLLYICIPGLKKQYLILLASVLIVGCFIRPQNQFLLFSLFFLPLFTFKGKKVFWFAFCILILLLSLVIKNLFASTGDITFPYSFSFLVGTPEFPGHQIFREYKNGFSLEQLWQAREQLSYKVGVGIHFLKQYWTGWLPHLLFLLLVFWRSKRHRGLAASICLVYMASLFFAAMGHLVPRYWEMLEPLVFLFLFIVFWKLFDHFRILTYTVLLILSFVAIKEVSFRWDGPSSELHLQSMPEALLEFIPSEGLLVSDRPSRIIDSLKRPILLCPQDIMDVKNIHNKVYPISAFVFTPNLLEGEISHWANEHPVLVSEGFQLREKDGWKIYFR